MEGRKNDEAKIRMELLPSDALRGIAEILTFGAEKYGDRNWEKGMAWSRIYGALLRHLTAWESGEVHDAETGKPHLWHAGCCIMFLISYEARGVGKDDRPALVPAPSKPELPTFEYSAPLGLSPREAYFGFSEPPTEVHLGDGISTFTEGAAVEKPKKGMPFADIHPGIR